MDKCAKCGAIDGQEIRGTPVSLRPCVCFAYVFCGETCLQAHPHSKLEDEAHFQPSIDVNFRRTFHRGSYPKLLLKLSNRIIEYQKQWQGTSGITQDMQDRLFKSPFAFATQVSTKERPALQSALKDYIAGIVQITTTGSVDRVLLDTPSQTLMRIWKSENKATFQRSSVEVAWTTYTSAVVKFLEDVISSEGNFTSSQVLNDIADLRRLSDAVGRVLNGGRWKHTETDLD